MLIVYFIHIVFPIMPEHVPSEVHADTQFSSELPAHVAKLLFDITHHRVNLVARPTTHWPLSPDEVHTLQTHKHQIPKKFWETLESSYPELKS